MTSAENKKAKKSTKVTKTCPECGKEFQVVPSHADRRTTCSRACAIERNRKITIDPEELRKLVWQKSTSKIARELGVSDKAVEKYCKKYGIDKPPVGYWAKVAAGKIKPEGDS